MDNFVSQLFDVEQRKGGVFVEKVIYGELGMFWFLLMFNNYCNINNWELVQVVIFDDLIENCYCVNYKWLISFQ